MTTNVPTLTKRVYDIRLFSVDVGPKLREGDVVTGFVDMDPLEAQVMDSEMTAELPTLAAAGTPVTANADGLNTVLNFTCAGGASGHVYEISIRYVSTSETQLESVIRVEVT